MSKKIGVTVPREDAPTQEPKLAEELQKMEWEPLLPVEKKLIATSICLGVVLLFVFIWISFTFFPGTH